MDKNYWYDKYAPKKHSKGYWKGRYKNTILRDQDYYLEHYINNSKSESKPEKKKDSCTWSNFRSGEQIIFLIALFIFLITRFK